MYTLEKHLQEIGVDNPQYNILLSIWNLNKSSLPLAQSNIIFNFPHYSLHERSHSETIVRNIESFLGEKRIKNLSPTDTWLILMSAHTHDLGMVVFHKALEEKWIEEEFQEYLENTGNSNRDVDLTKAANLLLEVQGSYKISKEPKVKLIRPLEIRKATILIISDYFRKVHHQRSREMIVGADKEFNKLMSNFNLDQLPNRFANILGDVAFAHGIDFYSVIDKLEYQSNGYASDKMHPRFVAYLLRLGDLLDVDDKRFNPFSEKVFNDSLPKLSHSHKEKHASTKHLLISPENIEITVDCKSDDVYRIAREWFDWLQSEVQNQAKEWSNIAPKDLTGLPPSISRGKLKVLYDNALPKEALMNLRFAISNEKIFEMLEGSAIYENPGFVFLREIIQNALDATKIQLWKDILNGNYNVILKDAMNITEEIDTDTIIKKIKFPTHIPNEIYSNYQISLKIYWDEDVPEVLVFDMQDKGTGISEENLIRMTTKVGESRSKDKNFLHFKKGMPYWLKPTGAFGIGLQSIFIISKEFVIQTKSDNEIAKEIIFVSSKNGEYSRVTPYIPEITRGTRSIVKINKGSFSGIFGTDMNDNVVESYDFFTDNFGSEYLLNLIAYIKDNFSDIKLLNAWMLNNHRIKESFYKNITEDKFEVIDKLESTNLKISVIRNESGDAYFSIDECLPNCGSNLELDFLNDLKYLTRDFGYTIRNGKYKIRDIPLKEAMPSYYLLSYLSLVWNLQNPDSDKVLNISRDKMIQEAKARLDEILLGQIIGENYQSILTLFESNFKKFASTDLKIAIKYFFAELTARMLGLQLKSLPEIYKEFALPEEAVCSSDFNQIRLIDFISASELVIVEDRNSYSDSMKNTQSIWDACKNDIPFVNDKSIIIWNDSFNSYTKRAKFKLKNFQAKLHKTEKGKMRLLRIYHITLNYSEYPVSVNIQTRAYLLKKLFKLKKERRIISMGVSDYPNVCVKNIQFDDYAYGEQYSTSYIISPLKSKAEVSQLISRIEKQNNNENDIILFETVRKYLDEKIPAKLIDWIISYNISSNKDQLTKQIIIKEYTKLTIDFLKIRNEINYLTFDNPDEYNDF